VAAEHNPEELHAFSDKTMRSQSRASQLATRATRMSDVHKGDPAARGRGNDVVSRFLGGPPLSVLLRLVLLSILVGVILSAVGLDPLHIWQSLETLIRRIWDMGFDAVRWAWRYFLLGAALVVPIWLFLRLTRGLGRL
jgi:hypothetical protein